LKLIINTTNLRKGGALQVANSFLEDLKIENTHEYHVFLSPAISQTLKKQEYSNNMQFYDCSYPNKFNFTGNNTKLDLLEKNISPDCVFSIFGPTYWKPKSPHVMGFANGIHVYTDLPFFKKLKFHNRIKEFVRRNYHKILLKNNADLYVVETDDLRSRLAAFLKVDNENIFTVPNAIHPVFDKPVNDLGILPIKKENEFWFITVTAYYEHKNLKIINEIIPLLEAKGLNCKFILTLPDNVFKRHFDNTSSYFLNVGEVNINQCPYLYSRADALFLPTLVECFTVSYLEAMKTNTFILTSDLPFARSICSESAIYFDPFDAVDAVKKIEEIIFDIELKQKLSNSSKRRFNEFPNSLYRTKNYIDICEKLVSFSQKKLVNKDK